MAEIEELEAIRTGYNDGDHWEDEDNNILRIDDILAGNTSMDDFVDLAELVDITDDLLGLLDSKYYV